MTATRRAGIDAVAQLPLVGLAPPEPDDTGRPGDAAPADATSVGLGVLLAHLGAQSSRRFADHVAALGLRAADAAVLRLLAFAPGLSQREIADRLGLQPSRLVALADSLEARHLVERTRGHTDRRHYELRLTPGGMALYGELAKAIATHDDECGGGLRPDERAQLVTLLSRLAADAGLACGPELHSRLP